jgi:hypothetical protein
MAIELVFGGCTAISVNNYGCFDATVDPAHGVGILIFDSISEFNRQTPSGQEICLIADICLLRDAFRCADPGVKPKTKCFNVVTLPKALASEQVIVARAAYFWAPPVSFRSAQVRSRSAGTSWCPATARRPSPRAPGTCARLPQRWVVLGCTVLADPSGSSILLVSVASVLWQRREAALFAVIAGLGALRLDLAQALDRGVLGYASTSVSARDLRGICAGPAGFADGRGRLCPARRS